MRDKLLKYKIGITLIPGIGSINAKKLIAYTGNIEAVFSEKKKNLLKIPGIGDSLAANIINHSILERAEKEIEFIERYGIKYSYYLDKDYPSRLKNCEDSPVILFYKGDVEFNQTKVLSIVGTRNATDYGKECCNKLLSDLQSRRHDVLIVSGLAYGIDICAHRAALKNGFDTVAVLGHGLGTLYPAVHKATAKDITKQGALVTDFVSDTKLDRNNFVKRNRIIAGLADATLVVESAIKGGALITADIAQSYNRDVLAFPGRVGDQYSRGCNWLVKTNKAALIESVEDLEYQLGWESPLNASAPKQTELFVEISEDEQRIVQTLRESGELPIDLICIHVDMPVSKVSALLLNLEFAGMVRSLPGKVYRLTR
ncbi:MAG: DNA-processing protein DprA [Bacteroidota bacterium]|nr:DNA-processing protein DprA [Bacteroidota bacterium]